MSHNDSRIKLTVQKQIVCVSILILAGKLAAFFLTNSVGILTDALESIVNVVTGFLSVISISVALKPHDANHPFGHGKVESLSASVEGFLILLAGIMIIIEAVKRFFVPSPIEDLGVGIVIVAIGGLLNYILGWYSIYTGKKHNSMALKAGGKHLQSDTYSTIGLVIGLLLLWITDISWLDSIIAIIFGFIIIYTGYKILKETTAHLMDETDFKAIKKLADILWKNKTPNWVEIHNLRLVTYGNVYHVDCDLVVPWYINVQEAHDESEILQNIVRSQYSEEMDFTIHMDACIEALCHQCGKENCTHRQYPYTDEDTWTVENITSMYSVHNNDL